MSSSDVSAVARRSRGNAEHAAPEHAAPEHATPEHAANAHALAASSDELGDVDVRWNSARARATLRRRLLGWYRRHQRDLPWRRDRDPYAIWISEIMLQQTQVAKVERFFKRFLERFPNPAALAAAEVEEVLCLWEGLGYYRRARQLHAAAQQMVRLHSGRFPDSYREVLALPGIGRYTAGAILSIAHDQRLPIVEANTLRLFSRLLALRGAPANTAAMNRLWEFATAILPQKGSGVFNQAAMELGSLVCTPRQPKCEQCVLASLCAAREQGLEAEIPGVVKKIAYIRRVHWGILARHENRVLLRRCQPGEHWEGLWDVPRYDVTEQKDPRGYVEERFRRDYQLNLQPHLHLLSSIKHGVTKFRIDLHVYHGSIQGSAGVLADPFESGNPSWGWFTNDQLPLLPLNTTGRAITSQIGSWLGHSQVS